jgi:hypothetical protein
MEKEGKILTRHPNGKNGVNISKKKYVTIYNAVLDSLAKNGMSYSDIYGTGCKK